MSDYIDYINSTLRELNIGEKVSPVHQQVVLFISYNFYFLSNILFSLSFTFTFNIGERVSPVHQQVNEPCFPQNKTYWVFVYHFFSKLKKGCAT